MNRVSVLVKAAAPVIAVLAMASSHSSATILTGAGGRGVPVGSSSLFTTMDYGDTFTLTTLGGAVGRPAVAAVQPLLPAYILELSNGNADRVMQIGAGYSFAAGDVVGAGGLVQGGASSLYPGGSGAGSVSGITQTGGAVDYAVEYGLRDVYTVQVDASQTVDRIDISSGGAVGIFAANSLSVFFRGDGSGNASLFNGTTDTPIQATFPAFNTGIAADRQWHNYAVKYDRSNKTVELFVDEASKQVIDLTTFAGGIYQNFSNGFVGAGAAGGDRTWTDNFQVGNVGPVTNPISDHPNPGPLAGLPAGLISFYDFNEAGGPVAGRTNNHAYDRKDGNTGWLVGTTSRVPGLVGAGAGALHDAAGEGVVIGPGTINLNTPNGLTVEMLFKTTYDGSDQAEFFRKEDGNNRILLSFQSDANTNNGSGQLIGTDIGFAGISLGLNTGGYKEMDVALDGLGGRPTLAQLADGRTHHIVASYDAATGIKSMYIDGVLVGQIDMPDNTLLVDGGAALAYIGSDRGGEVFPGALDEVAIYDRAISSAEVLAHYQNSVAGLNYFVVPEPGTLGVVVLGGLAALVRRRRR